MVAEVNFQDVFSINTRQTRAPEKVGQVEPARPVQKLPGDGNRLPPENHQDKAETKDIDDAVQDLNKHVQSSHLELQFSIDKDSGHTVIEVLDINTKEVIRKIPNEEVLKFARLLNEGADLELINTYI